uniref:Transcription factor RelB-like n=1 Tax=Seriola dumerili TaxID=41447 RepID=A0A3B4V4P1_SERDU
MHFVNNFGPFHPSCLSLIIVNVLNCVQWDVFNLVNPAETLLKPRLVVVEEPKDRGMRFRYECEGRSAGSILGVSSTDTNKTQPAIEVQTFVVTVTVSLVTKDLPHRPHPHCLVGKDCPNGSGICVVTFNPHSNRRHSFANLGIQCVRRKELDLSLQKRSSQNIDPFKSEWDGIEDLDMNAVRLCFQCELEWEDGRKDSLSPVVSSTIYDKKATTTSQLKITCLNQYKGPCTGKTEIYMLCDKVLKGQHVTTCPRTQTAALMTQPSLITC